MTAPTVALTITQRYRLKDLKWEVSAAVPAGRVMLCKGLKIRSARERIRTSKSGDSGFQVRRVCHFRHTRMRQMRLQVGRRSRRLPDLLDPSNLRIPALADLLRRLGGNDDMTGLVVDKARELLERVHAAYKCQLLPLAAGLGTVKLGRPRNAGLIFGANVADSDRGAFNFAWPLSEIEPFAAPIPCRGAQGFWKWPYVEARVA